MEKNVLYYYKIIDIKNIYDLSYTFIYDIIHKQ